MGDYSVIEVYNKTYKRYFYTLVDTEDLQLIEDNAQSLSSTVNSSNNYCVLRRKDNKETQPLHRLIMNTPGGLVVDHINHNGLDNRKRNLRNCTHKENMNNRWHVNRNPLYWSAK